MTGWQEPSFPCCPVFLSRELDPWQVTGWQEIRSLGCMAGGGELRGHDVGLVFLSRPVELWADR